MLAEAPEKFGESENRTLKQHHIVECLFRPTPFKLNNFSELKT